jgi:endonuclease/exonuclease/phosphatase family metal-dependent hydrolase
MPLRIRPSLSLLFAMITLAVSACSSSVPDGESGTVVAPQDDRSRSLRVVTYNIRYANPNDGDNVWEHRRDAMAAYLRDTAPDLIGLQEAEPEQRGWLAEQLTENGWYGIGRNAEHDQGEGTPIFYRLERFEVLDRGTFWLSTTPDVPGSIGWDAALPRVASWLRLGDRVTNNVVLMVNTHLDHRGPEARVQSARLIVDRIDELASSDTGRLPVILTGDFNNRPGDPPYLAITAGKNENRRLTDARLVSRSPHVGGDSTSNGFKAISPGVILDHVFVRDVAAVLSHRYDDPRIEERFVSDHLPVVVEIETR